MTDFHTLMRADPAAMAPGAVVDGYKTLRDIRLAMQKEVDEVEARERAYREWLIANTEKGDSKGIVGRNFIAVHKTKEVPIVDPDGGWEKLKAFILKEGRLDLLQRRISDSAVKAMIEAGETPPGVTSMYVSDISVTKLK